MLVMGLRASSQEVRYAILIKDENGDITFTNHNTENRLRYPANINTIDAKLAWVKEEIDRILRKNGQINKVSIKVNEYALTDTKAKRETSYVEGIFCLCAAEHNIPIARKINTQLNSSSSKAKERAEILVGRTEKNWNNTMADAILAAFWEIR